MAKEILKAVYDLIMGSIGSRKLRSAGATGPTVTVSRELPAFASDKPECVLTRGPSTPEGTFGRLVHESGWSCVTLELPWKNNIVGHSHIYPAPGDEPVIYEFKRDYSPARGRDTFEAIYVVGRKEIDIHVGNLAGDIACGFVSNVEGCLLLGRGIAVFKGGTLPAGPKDQRGITSSGETIADFERVIGSRNFRMEIK